MARWEPDARGRLVDASMQLFRERGFDQTTVADIAARAGLTERTFFRYFADKREVLFAGSGLQDALVEGVSGAPASASPIDAVTRALEATASFFEERRDFACKRHALISAHAELRERELIKLASLADAIRAALRRRGVPASAAGLTAEAGIAIFKIAFENWVEDRKKQDLAHHVRAARGELGAITGGSRGASRASRPVRRRVSRRSG